jgi:hypothetical protein
MDVNVDWFIHIVREVCMDRDKDTLLRGLLACLFGAIIGALLASKFGVYTWWLGAIIGGPITYLTYDLKQVAAAGKQAYREVIAWHPATTWWKAWFAGVFNCFGAALTLSSLGWILFNLQFFLGWLGPVSTAEIAISAIFIPLIAGVICLITTTVAFVLATEADLERMSHNLRYIRNPLKFYFRYAPAALWTGIPVVLRKCCLFLVRMAMKIPACASKLGEWFKRTFVLIHSEYRMIAGADAVLGATAVYMLDSWLAGLAIVAVLYLVNVELVAKRWLGIQPQR